MGSRGVLSAHDIRFRRNDCVGVEHAVGTTKGKKAREVPVPIFVLHEISKLCQDKSMDALVFPARNGTTCRGRSRTAVVRWCSQASRGSGGYSTRSPAYVRIPGGLGRRQRLGAAANARAQEREGHAGYLRRSLRRRLGRRRRGPTRPVFTGECGQRPTQTRRRSKAQPPHQRKRGKSYGGGGGI
jgi:hypothetical protein